MLPAKIFAFLNFPKVYAALSIHKMAHLLRSWKCPKIRLRLWRQKLHIFKLYDKNTSLQKIKIKFLFRTNWVFDAWSWHRRALQPDSSPGAWSSSNGAWSLLQEVWLFWLSVEHPASLALVAAAISMSPAPSLYPSAPLWCPVSCNLMPLSSIGCAKMNQVL